MPAEELFLDHLKILHVIQMFSSNGSFREDKKRAILLKNATKRVVFAQVFLVFYLRESVRNGAQNWWGPVSVRGKNEESIYFHHGGSVIRLHANRAEHVFPIVRILDIAFDDA